MRAAKDLSRGGQLQLLTLLFLLLAALLLQVFAAAWQLSERGRCKNSAIRLCRAGTEVFALTGETDEVSRALGGAGERELFFDAQGQPASAEESVWSLRLSDEEETTAAGVLRTLRLTAVREGETLYELEGQRYLPGGGDAP